MNERYFSVEIDGRRVLVDQSSQEVVVLDGAGRPAHLERIQVAAGSVQGLFAVVEDATAGMQPFTRA